MSSRTEVPEGLYPMRVVTRMTGLSVDTIRAWERRHGAVQPERTEGNTRRYSAEQVRRLTLLKEATDNGHAIKDVAHLPEARLSELVEAIDRSRPTHEGESYGQIVHAYLEAVEAFETRRATELISRATALLPPPRAVYDVVIPILREVGRRWQCGEFTIAHEHLVSAELEGLLSTMLNMTAPLPGASKIVVATPEHHRHAFGALVGALIAAHRGLDPIYLGIDVPWEDIRYAQERSGAEVVLISVLRDVRNDELARTESALAELSKQTEVWLGCPPHHPLADESGAVRSFHRYEDFDLALNELT